SSPVKLEESANTAPIASTAIKSTTNTFFILPPIISGLAQDQLCPFFSRYTPHILTMRGLTVKKNNI
ncbi:MAG: hypothetical protein K6F82_00040, partial [Sphaerochaetaceae bacterium]|nr:hypothetical protein [Sphaerochaetaceae bacterium]